VYQIHGTTVFNKSGQHSTLALNPTDSGVLSIKSTRNQKNLLLMEGSTQEMA